MGSPQCYVKLNNTVVASNWKTCGRQSESTPNLQCCADGDFCLSNGLCRYSHSEVGASGYYAGGCTSQDYRDGSCPQLCNAQGKKDVVFDAKQRIWSCCGGDANSSPHCDTPTNDNFGAPAMNQLNTIYQAGIGNITSSTSDNSNRNRPGPTSPPSSTIASPTSTMETSTRPRVVVVTKTPAPTAVSSKVSAGLAGGVGAGAAVIVLLISGFLFWLWRRKRKARSSKTETPYKPITGREQPAVAKKSRAKPFTPMAYVNANEIRAKVVRHEMSQESVRVSELDAVEKRGRRQLGRMDGIQEMDGADAVARNTGG